MPGPCRRIYLSASRKSSGKTCLAIGLLRALQQRGISPQPFKKGPDYIDPMWLARAAQRPCYNLDFNTQTPLEITATAQRGSEADISLIEGTKGLFDGVAEDGSDSNAAMATLLQAPIALVLDSEGMTRGIAALAVGYQQFDPDLKWAGIILNRTGGSRHETKLVQALEGYTDFVVLGAIGKSEDMELTERHLGLIPCIEQDDAEQRIERIHRHVSAGLDLGRLLECADAPPLDPPLNPTNPPSTDLRIGYARDAAFGFYYADDLQQFAHQGAELVPFDSLHDPQPPEVDALWLGGGFPEVQAARLASNTSMKQALFETISAGLPTYAECGGLMYLARTLTWQDHTHDMIGMVPGDCVMHPRPQGRGLVTLEASEEFPWPGVSAGLCAHAHEFHYSRLENLDSDLRWGWQVTRGAGAAPGQDGLVLGNLFASYSHLRHTQRFEWIRHFIQFVRSRA